tara:strand:+ start:542 stop:763 length:222 start_codon:yes stop_codon:yes gene_type:complete
MNIYKKLPEDIKQKIDIIFLHQQNKYYNLSVLQLNKLFNLYNKNFNTTSKLIYFMIEVKFIEKILIKIQKKNL